MIVPQIPKNENERLKALKSYSILDTLPETDYDDLTSIAAEICGTPIALISLIDEERQWFKSHHGVDATETPKEYAFCAHAINDIDNTFIIPDSRKDERFHDNPLVTNEPNVIFYAGVPLVNSQKLALGTLCVIDHTPKQLSPSQIKSLRALANQVINLLELRKNKDLLEKSILKLEERNLGLERFAYVAAHDLKSPLIGISGISQLFTEKYSSSIDQNGKDMLKMMINATDKLRKLVDGLLEYSKSESVLNENKALINIEALLKEINSLFSSCNNLELRLNTNIREIFANRTAIDQILINLVTNAIKYNDKDKIEITVGFFETETHYECFVEDNGTGIEPSKFEKIFQIFEVGVSKDRFGITGNGIGLATVKRIIEKMGGSIEVQSEINKGSKFRFTFEK
jgi:signal transduction histidine kinase